MNGVLVGKKFKIQKGGLGVGWMPLAIVKNDLHEGCFYDTVHESCHPYYSLMKRLFLFFFLFSFPLYARLNVSVTENPQIYHTIDQLIAFGLVDNALLSQKPISFSEVIRIKDQAKENLSRIEGGEIETRARLLIKQLEEVLPKDPSPKKIHINPLSKLRTEYLFLDSPDRPVLANIDGSHIDAIVNPLIAYRAGRPFVDGQNFQFEMAQQLFFEPYFSIAGQPQFFLQRRDASGSNRLDANFDHFYLRSEFKNIGIQAGRDQVIWGPHLYKGNVFSANARGLDMLKVSNVHPFHLPWVLKYLGYMDASFFFAVLGADRDFPHPYITAFKLSFLPHHNFQFGFTAATLSGGEGSPNSSLGSRVLDPFVGYILNVAGGDSPIDDFASDRLGGFDFKYRMPFLRGAEIYYEVTFEDLNTRMKYYMETFNRGGLYFPRLSNDGRHALRLEYNFAGWFQYRHAQFTSGWTHHRKLLGDELGPDSQAFHVEYAYRPTRFWENHLNVSWEARDSDIYNMPPIPQPITKTADGLAEQRYRVLAGFNWLLTETFNLGFDFGAERLLRFNHTAGTNFNNFLTNLKLTWFPRER